MLIGRLRFLGKWRPLKIPGFSWKTTDQWERPLRRRRRGAFDFDVVLPKPVFLNEEDGREDAGHLRSTLRSGPGLGRGNSQDRGQTGSATTRRVVAAVSDVARFIYGWGTEWSEANRHEFMRGAGPLRGPQGPHGAHGACAIDGAERLAGGGTGRGPASSSPPPTARIRRATPSSSRRPRATPSCLGACPRRRADHGESEACSWRPSRTPDSPEDRTYDASRAGRGGRLAPALGVFCETDRLSGAGPRRRTVWRRRRRRRPGVTLVRGGYRAKITQAARASARPRGHRRWRPRPGQPAPALPRISGPWASPQPSPSRLLGTRRSALILSLGDGTSASSLSSLKRGPASSAAYASAAFSTAGSSTLLDGGRHFLSRRRQRRRRGPCPAVC